MAVFFLFGCEKNSPFYQELQRIVDEYNNGDIVAGIPVVFQGVVQIGGTSGTVESTDLELTFDKDPKTLSVNDITVTGAKRGDLTGSGTSRNLSIFDINIANAAEIEVTIADPEGYSIIDSSKNVVVYRIIEGNMSIGMDYRGGKIAYIFQLGDPGYDANVPHGLIYATSDQSTSIVWISGGNTQTTSVPGGTFTTLGTGSANTNNIIAQAEAAGNNNETTYAAGVARNYNGGGYSDWYLPSKDELNKLYLSGQITSGSYWSSSEELATHATHQVFSSGSQLPMSKDASLDRVRAMRSF